MKSGGSRQSYCKNKQAYFFGPPCKLCNYGVNVLVLHMHERIVMF